MGFNTIRFIEEEVEKDQTEGEKQTEEDLVFSLFPVGKDHSCCHQGGQEKGVQRYNS